MPFLAIDRRTLAGLDRIVGRIGREPDVGRRQQLHAAVLGVLGRLAYLLRRLEGADDRAGDGHRQARLLHLRLEGRAVPLAGFEDVDGLGGDVDVAGRGDDVGADLPVGFAGLEGDVAFDAADGTRRSAGAGTLLIGAEHLAAEGEADPATAEEAAFLGLLVVRLGVGFRCRFDEEVATGAGVEVGGGGDVAAGDPKVVAGLEGDGVAAEGGRLRVGVFEGVALDLGLAREGAAALLLLGDLAVFAGFAGFEDEVVASHGGECAGGAGDAGGTRAEVVGGTEKDGARAFDRGADLGGGAAAILVGGVGAGVVLFGDADRAETEVAAGVDDGAAGALQLRGVEREVGAGGERKGAAAVVYVERCEAVDVGAGEPGVAFAVLGVAGGALDGQLPSGDGLQGVAGFKRAAADGEVLPGAEGEGLSADPSAEVPEVLGVERDDLPAGDGALVVEVAGKIDGDLLAAEQGTRGGEVAVADADIDLRDERLLRAAIGQRDFLLDEPDDVARQLGDLGFAECDAGDELQFAGNGDAGVHQRGVLRFVRAVAVEKATAGELGDLFGEQPLFVETVAEAFLGGGGVVGELAQHVVRAQPLAVTGKARVSLDQVVGGRVRGRDEEAAGAIGGLAGTAEVHRGDRCAAAGGNGIGVESGDAEVEAGDDRGRAEGVMRTKFEFFVVAVPVAELCPAAVGCGAGAFGAGVVQCAACLQESAAGDDTAVRIGQIPRKDKVATGEDLARR